MGLKGSNSLATDDLPVQDEEVTTHQEAVPLPYLAGKRKVACRWIGPAMNLITKKSANATPGKK